MGTGPDTEPGARALGVTPPPGNPPGPAHTRRESGTPGGRRGHLANLRSFLAAIPGTDCAARPAVERLSPMTLPSPATSESVTVGLSVPRRSLSYSSSWTPVTHDPWLSGRPEPGSESFQRPKPQPGGSSIATATIFAHSRRYSIMCIFHMLRSRPHAIVGPYARNFESDGNYSWSEQRRIYSPYRMILPRVFMAEKSTLMHLQVIGVSNGSNGSNM
jgi:hypothetical protein